MRPSAAPALVAFPPAGRAAAPDVRVALERARREIDAGLASIDFTEVTHEDRVTFVEHAAVWLARCALRAGSFPLALAIVRHGRARIEELERDRTRMPGGLRRSG